MKVLSILLFATMLCATSTLTKERLFTQNDGTTFKGRLQGDAFLHWIQSEDGSIVLFNKKSATFEYAEIRDGDLKLSGKPYSKSTTRALSPNISKEALRNLFNARHPKH